MNYSLLRPFDLEAAKCGDLLTDSEDRCRWSYVAGPDARNEYVMLIEGDAPNKGEFTYPSRAEEFRMAPLAWVEDKPVYPGDVLYWSGRLGVESGAKFTARSSGGGFIRGETLFADGIRIAYEQSEGMLPESLTWTPPKQKKEMWVNVYPAGDGCGHPTKEKADQVASSGRIACVRLEYEV